MDKRARPNAKSKLLQVAKEKERPQDLSALRQEIVDTIKRSALEMVNTTVAQASEGNYTAMKYLFELAGLYPALPATETSAVDEPLALTLLRRLGIVEDQSPKTSAKGENPGHAVE